MEALIELLILFTNLIFDLRLKRNYYFVNNLINESV